MSAKTAKKLALLGGGMALGAVALRRSVVRATDLGAIGGEGTEPLPAPEPPRPARRVSARFDALFRRYGRGLPVAYLRSLGKRESNLDPADRTGPAWGLLQVMEVVRRDYNERHGTDYARTDLLEPRINIAIATDLLKRIIASYARNHPATPNLQLDWSNRRFVELLTFGWNAGYSERGGVGRVARFLEAEGRAGEITIDTIHEAAATAGASRHLSNPKKVRWCKSVARLHASERLRKDVRR